MSSHLNATVRHGAYLPHWTKEGGTYHVRFRLADSIPQHVLKEWKEEREKLKRAAVKEKRSLTKSERERLSELSSERVEYYLQSGYGSCSLQQGSVAAIVAHALQKGDGKTYRLSAWCIMPNHVHVVVQPLTKELHKILQTWKRITAQKANKLLRRSGTLWQEESFDHLIRNDREFERIVEYVWRNPDEAGLKNWKWRWKM